MTLILLLHSSKKVGRIEKKKGGKVKLNLPRVEGFFCVLPTHRAGPQKRWNSEISLRHRAHFPFPSYVRDANLSKWSSFFYFYLFYCDLGRGMLSRGKKEGLDPITGFSFYIKAFFSLLCATVSWSDLYFLENKKKHFYVSALSDAKHFPVKSFFYLTARKGEGSKKGTFVTFNWISTSVREIECVFYIFLATTTTNSSSSFLAAKKRLLTPSSLLPLLKPIPQKKEGGRVRHRVTPQSHHPSSTPPPPPPLRLFGCLLLLGMDFTIQPTVERT